VFLLGGEPIKVPPHLGCDELQQYVDRIQEEMDRLNEAAELFVLARGSSGIFIVDFA